MLLFSSYPGSIYSGATKIAAYTLLPAGFVVLAPGRVPAWPVAVDLRDHDRLGGALRSDCARFVPSRARALSPRPGSDRLGATFAPRRRYLPGTHGRYAMAKAKPHDLRDDIYAPPTTVTNTDERLAGAEPGECRSRARQSSSRHARSRQEHPRRPDDEGLGGCARNSRLAFAAPMKAGILAQDQAGWNRSHVVRHPALPLELRAEGAGD